MKKSIILCAFFALFSNVAFSQLVWENPKKEIYQFLNRQAQKGNIDLQDLIQPFSRKDIAKHLTTLDSLGSQLSTVERQELTFYMREYGEFNSNLQNELSILKKDQHGRLRMLSVREDDFLLNADPTLALYGIRGSGKNIFGISNGVQFWGHAGKNIGFQAGFTDNTENGDGIDKLRAFTPENGIVRTEGNDPKTLNFSDFRGSVTFNWKNGSIAVGNDQITYGYGENGKMILSDKAPARPYIRLDYQPLKWLSFNYMHMWLNSGIIDSAAIYNKGNNIYGDNRDLYIPKFFATHSLNFYPVKGLTLTAGESVVYSDRMNAGYLFPLMFFKVYDQHASRHKVVAGSNSQFFFQVSSRNHLKNTHLYATLFIDEISLNKAFNPEISRNQLGYNIGASITDLLVPHLTFGAEYTRLNPFNYQNIIPAQDYTHQNYVMGDWMGANADRVIAFIKYTPIQRLKTTLSYQVVRKGSPGTLFDQYFAEPQPKFLEDYAFKQNIIQFKASYELLNNLYVEGSIQHTELKNVSPSSNDQSTFGRFGVRLGF